MNAPTVDEITCTLTWPVGSSADGRLSLDGTAGRHVEVWDDPQLLGHRLGVDIALALFEGRSARYEKGSSVGHIDFMVDGANVRVRGDGIDETTLPRLATAHALLAAGDVFVETEVDDAMRPYIDPSLQQARSLARIISDVEIEIDTNVIPGLIRARVVVPRSD